MLPIGMICQAALSALLARAVGMPVWVLCPVQFLITFAVYSDHTSQQ
jgi:hypothetical protein